MELLVFPVERKSRLPVSFQLDGASAKRSTAGIEIDVGEQVDSTISNRRGNLDPGALQQIKDCLGVK